MAELQLRAVDRDHSGALCGLERFGTEREELERGDDVGAGTGLACSGEQERAARRLGERIELARERALDAGADRRRISIGSLPARCASLSRADNSSNASGLPPVAAKSRSATAGEAPSSVVEA